MINNNELGSTISHVYSVVSGVISSNSWMDLPSLIDTMDSRTLTSIRIHLHWGVNQRVRVLPWMTTGGSMFDVLHRLTARADLFDFKAPPVPFDFGTSTGLEAYWSCMCVAQNACADAVDDTVRVEIASKLNPTGVIFGIRGVLQDALDHAINLLVRHKEDVT